MRRASILPVLLAACGGAAAGAPPPEPEPDEEGPTAAIALRFAEAPTDEATGTPFTRVLLVTIVPDEGRSTTEAGIFEGACQHVVPREGAVLEARCWWAGFGAEVVVRREGDSLVVQRIRLDEHTRAPEPEEAARVELPPRARLDPIVPATLR